MFIVLIEVFELISIIFIFVFCCLCSLSLLLSSPFLSASWVFFFFCQGVVVVVVVEPSLHAWNKTNLIMVHDLFDVLLNLLCKYCIEDFYHVFIKNIGLSFSSFSIFNVFLSALLLHIIVGSF